jgi:transcriptional regulator with XRE-family HTH domain
MDAEITRFLVEKCAEKRGEASRLARKLGISTGAVSKWVTGQMKPDFVNCLLISEFYRLPARKVLEMSGEQSYLDIWDSFFPLQRPNPPTAQDVYPDTWEHHAKLEAVLKSHMAKEADWIAGNLDVFYRLLEAERERAGPRTPEELVETVAANPGRAEPKLPDRLRRRAG